MTKHGHCKNDRFTPEYTSYCAMIQRCYYTKHKNYNRYGGRGIKVCPRWRHSFKNFIQDMGLKKDNSHTLERKNNNLGYSKSNCRWATRRDQCNNMSRNRMLKFNGKTQSVSMWTSELGWPRGRISARLNSLGWSVKKALTT